MESDIDKCTILVMKSGQQHMTEVIKAPNQEKILNSWRKDRLNIFGIL